MSLTTLGGRLLLVGGRLAQSFACCCTRWCRSLGRDPCGNTIYTCTNEQAGSVGPCSAQCRPPQVPCECGPDVPCPPCGSCSEGKCERIPDCCADGSPCPPCSKCVDGQCGPCGECEQCVNGLCAPCGECQKCVDGVCGPCGPDEVCIGGVCVPKQYYCCWASAADKRLNTNNTTCKAATVSGGTQTSPCGTGTEEGQTGEVDLTKSGPYTGLQQCEPNCRKYKCAPDACGNNQCVPAGDGPYPTRDACLAACDDPCSMPCSFAGSSTPGVFSIDGCERDICVAYSSPKSRPIRVQIWGPVMQNGCPVPGSRVIKSDSNWRGDPCCDCPDTRPAGALQGTAKGQVTWSKPRGATSFEVVVLDPCVSNYTIDVQACSACTAQPDPAPCDCEDDGDCGPDCQCCDGKCQSDPCGCDQPCDPSCGFQQVGGDQWVLGGGAPHATCFLPGKAALVGQCQHFWINSWSRSRLDGQRFYESAGRLGDYCVRVKFKWRYYMCTNNELRDITNWVGKPVAPGQCQPAACVTEQCETVDMDENGDPIDPPITVCTPIRGNPLVAGGFARLGECLEGEYCYAATATGGFGVDCDECPAAAPAAPLDPVLNCEGDPP